MPRPFVLILYQFMRYHIVSSYRYVCRPGGIPARNFRGERLLLYIGIIDILQSYRLTKRLEHAMKSIVYDAVCLLVSAFSRLWPYVSR